MNNDGVQLRIGDIMHAVIKRWKMILALTILGLLLGFVLSRISAMQGTNMSYSVDCSFAVTSRLPSGRYLNGSTDYTNNDLYVAQDMTDAASYVILSRHVLETAAASTGLIGVTAQQVSRNLEITRYNETQILEMTLHWRSSEEGIELANAIINAANEIIPKTLDAGKLEIINEPRSEYILGGSSLAGLWIIMGVLGFFAGVLITVFEMIMRPTVLNPDDVESAFGVDQIGAIHQNDRYFSRKLNINAQDVRASEEVQSFNAAAHIIENRVSNRKAPHCFYVTSTRNGEGKTVISANLAVRFAAMGYKTLVIDLDTHAPSLGGLFLGKVEYDRSLNALYAGSAVSEDIITHLSGNLDLIPLLLDANFASLNHSMIELVRSLVKKYDYVVIDAPAVGIYSDTLMLNELADSAVYVIRYDHTSTREIDRALDKLDKSGVRILGCIVNGIENLQNDTASSGSKASVNAGAASNTGGVDVLASLNAVSENLYDTRQDTLHKDDFLKDYYQDINHGAMEHASDHTLQTGDDLAEAILREQNGKDRLPDEKTTTDNKSPDNLKASGQSNESDKQK
ncbi:MAG: AAA family ATPase [Oribacterium sp.]|nr:AAA family ATPase [Oribacterium sp.]